MILGWSCSLLVAVSFLTALQGLGIGGIFMVFGVFSVIALTMVIMIAVSDVGECLKHGAVCNMQYATEWAVQRGFVCSAMSVRPLRQMLYAICTELALPCRAWQIGCMGACMWEV